MRWPEAGVDPFPSPHRGEPANLRADILDELADHLALAVDSEVEANGLSHEHAWKRVLDRFGNPDAIARRLWWDAMKERIMRDWIQTGIAGLSAAVVVLVSVFVFTNIRAMQATQVTLVEMMKDLNNRSQTPTGETLDIEVRRGSAEGLPATGVRVELSRKLNPDDNAKAALETDTHGRVRFTPVAQGVYNLVLTDPQSSMTFKAEHSLFAGVGSKRLFIAPDFAAVQTRFLLKPELPFPNDRVLVAVDYETSHKAGDSVWFRKGCFLVGHAGIYEIGDRLEFPPPRDGEPPPPAQWSSFTNPLGAPAPAIPLPPVELRLTKIQPAFRDPEGGFGRHSDSSRDAPRHDQTANLVQDRENVVTLELTEAEVKLAEVIAMNCTARKWQPDRQPWWTPPVNGYVVTAVPIELALPVGCELDGENKARVDVIERPIDQEGTFSAWRILRLTDPERLIKSYPPECRFVVAVSDIESGDFYPWTGTEWSAEANAVFPVALEKPIPSSGEAGVPCSVDITTFIRGDAAKAPYVGVLVHMMDHSGKQQLKPSGIWRSANLHKTQQATVHLVVVRDTPPDDL